MAKDKLSMKQEQCLDLMLSNYRISGRKTTIEQIAKKIGVTRQTVSNWMHKDELFREEYDRRIREINKYAQAQAINTMVKLLDCKHAPTRLGAAKDILDRAGFKPAEDVNIHGDAVRVTIVDDMGG